MRTPRRTVDEASVLHGVARLGGLGDGDGGYATSDGSATAGADYTAVSGTLSFRAGERTQTVEVELLDDNHDEGEETFTLTLSNASGAVITDGQATDGDDREPRPDAVGSLGAVRACGGGARG